MFAMQDYSTALSLQCHTSSQTTKWMVLIFNQCRLWDELTRIHLRLTMNCDQSRKWNICYSFHFLHWQWECPCASLTQGHWEAAGLVKLCRVPLICLPSSATVVIYYQAALRKCVQMHTIPQKPWFSWQTPCWADVVFQCLNSQFGFRGVLCPEWTTVV